MKIDFHFPDIGKMISPPPPVREGPPHRREAELRGKPYTGNPLNPERQFIIEAKRKAVFFGAVPRARPNPDAGGGGRFAEPERPKKSTSGRRAFFKTEKVL